MTDLDVMMSMLDRAGIRYARQRHEGANWHAYPDAQVQEGSGPYIDLCIDQQASPQASLFQRYLGYSGFGALLRFRAADGMLVGASGYE